jgi:uncharacterized protein (TIGR03118 family)
MSFPRWLRNLCPTLAPGRDVPRRPRRAAAPRPALEVLDDRTVPSGYQQTDLAGNLPGLGHVTDANLNGWGMTSLPDGSFCVANTFTTGRATFYDRSGHVLPLSITVPDSVVGSTALGLPLLGHPTGVVYNPTSEFVITAHGKSAPAVLIFDSIDGIISGWNPAVDPTHAIVIADTFADGHPAAFTGLDIARNSQGRTVLYAADVLNNRVDMLDGSFNPIGSFTDPSVTGFGAWSVQAVDDRLYVTFADPFAPVAGPHGGVVDVFDTDGQLQSHFAANAPGAGPLENPWGIARAPANFGAFSNDILIGNVAGAGTINAFDPATGAYLGQLRQPNGAPVTIKGLWDLEFGDGPPNSGKTNQLFFDAGPNHPGDSTGGLFGVIRAAGDQGGNGGGRSAREAATSTGMALIVTERSSVPVGGDSFGLSPSLSSLVGGQYQRIDARVPRSQVMPMTPAFDRQARDRRTDIFFSTEQKVVPQESRPESMAPQRSGHFSMFDADLDVPVMMAVRV